MTSLYGSFRKLTIAAYLVILLVHLSNASSVRAAQSTVVSATPTVVQEGFTTDLTVNCTFPSGGDISNIHSLILSKTDNTDGATAVEIAKITDASSNVVTVDHSLGAQVSGKLTSNGDAYIAYKWSYPTNAVLGKYSCSVYGMDNQGHPYISTGDAHITQQTVSLDSVLAKLRDLEQMQISQNMIIAQQSHQLTDLYSRLNSSRDAMMLTHGQYEGHHYYLSHKLWRNEANDDSICRMLGGHLVVIEDASEFAFMKSFLQSASPRPTTVLTGVSENGHVGVWTAVHSGQAVSYLNWGPHQPDRTRGNDCVYLESTYSYKMSDGPCVRDDWVQVVCESPN